MKTIFTKLVMSAGYRDTAHFIDSAFHPQLGGTCAGISAFFAGDCLLF
jgi:hypothetical protein